MIVYDFLNLLINKPMNIDKINSHNPELCRFLIDVTRTSFASNEFVVEAADEKEAVAKVLEIAGNTDFGSGNTEYEITHIKKL
jgi:hypothetical protein